MKIAILIVGENHTDGIAPAILNDHLDQLTRTSPASLVFCMEEREEWTLHKANNENNNIAGIVENALSNIPELLQFQQLSPSGIYIYFPIDKKEKIKQTLIDSGKIPDIESLNFLLDCLITYNMRAEKAKLFYTLHHMKIPFLCIDNTESRNRLTLSPSIENIIKEERRRIDTMVNNILTKAIPLLINQQGGTIIVYVGHGHVKNLAASLTIRTNDYDEYDIKISAVTLAFPPDVKDISCLEGDAPMKLKDFDDFDRFYNEIDHKIFFCTRDSNKYDFNRVVEFFKQTFNLDYHRVFAR